MCVVFLTPQTASLPLLIATKVGLCVSIVALLITIILLFSLRCVVSLDINIYIYMWEEVDSAWFKLVTSS